VKYIVIVR